MRGSDRSILENGFRCGAVSVSRNVRTDDGGWGFSSFLPCLGAPDGLALHEEVVP